MAATACCSSAARPQAPCLIATMDMPYIQMTRVMRLPIQVVELESGAVVRTLPGVSNPSNAAQLACSYHPMSAHRTLVCSKPAGTR